MTPRPLLACVMTLTAFVLGADDPHDPFADMKKTPEYQAAFKQGVAEAEKELADGRASVYTYGLRGSFGNLDRETGLPYRAIAGCVVDNTILGRAEGHNGHIANAIKGGKIPANSFKPWESELFALKAFFEAQAATRTPQPIERNGAAVASPFGDSLKVTTETKISGEKPYTETKLHVRSAGKASTPLWFGVAEPDESVLDVAWGPRGSGFAVIRETKPADRSVSYTAVDVRNGGLLRWE